MDKFEALEIKEEAARIKARSSLISFIEFTKPEYETQWFHKIIAVKCEDILFNRIKKLMIFVPPQHGKSEIVSRKLPAFAFGIDPNLKLAGCSYSSDLAEGFSRDIQRTIDSPEYNELFPRTSLNGSNVRSNAFGTYIRTVEKFEIVGHRGHFKAVGVCGPLTGNAVDIGIIDDPVKDSIEANSQTYRDRVWDWYMNVFKTRMHNDSREIIMMTRWHEDDLAGRLLKLEPNEWEVVCFEGVYETPTKYDTRKIGDSLWENKHSKERLLDIFRLSPQTFSALIQQNPKEAMSGNEFFKSFNPDNHVKTIQYTPLTTLHISIDYNVYPYIAITCWQLIRNGNGWIICQINELPASDPDNTASRAGKKVSSWLKSLDYKNMIYLYGDWSTQNMNGIDEDKRSFFKIFEETLQKGGYKTQNNLKPHVSPAGIANFINAIFNKELQFLEIQISDKCFLSIKDYKETKADKDGNIFKKKIKNREGISYEPNGHLVDTFKDFIAQAFKQEFVVYQNRGINLRPLGVSQIKRSMYKLG